ncbi:MAG: V-type ATP synthase subunit F [Brevinematia bacterium]
MKTIFFGDSETATFFELQGIETRIVETRDQFFNELKKIKRTKNCGLLIVTEEIATFAREDVDLLRFSRELPLVIDIPSMKGEVKEKINLFDYIRGAIGIKI